MTNIGLDSISPRFSSHLWNERSVAIFLAMVALE
jgi:hypothetical protein